MYVLPLPLPLFSDYWPSIIQFHPWLRPTSAGHGSAQHLTKAMSLPTFCWCVSNLISSQYWISGPTAARTLGTHALCLGCFHVPWNKGSQAWGKFNFIIYIASLLLILVYSKMNLATILCSPTMTPSIVLWKHLHFTTCLIKKSSVHILLMTGTGPTPHHEER